MGAVLARDALVRGYDVTVFARPGSDLWRLVDIRSSLDIRDVDLRDPDATTACVSGVRPEIVFHLAAHGAYSWQGDTTEILETNILGTSNLLNAAAIVGVSAFLHTGSSSEYGFMNAFARETDVLAPNSVYAVGKAAGTHLVALAAAEGRVPGATARLYSAYGPWEEPQRLLPRLVSAAIAGGWPPLANPDIARDFVYVDDVVAALWTLALTEDLLDGSAYNISSGAQTSLARLATVARSVFDIPSEPVWGAFEPRAWDSSIWVGDPSRLLLAAGWRASVDLEMGLRAFADWLGGASGIAARYA